MLLARASPNHEVGYTFTPRHCGRNVERFSVHVQSEKRRRRAMRRLDDTASRVECLVSTAENGWGRSPA